MAVANGIFGIILSFALIFVALLIFDAFDQNVVDCSQFSNNTLTSCNNTKTYVDIAFIILPITILFDVIGLLPIFGGKFSFN